MVEQVALARRVVRQTAHPDWSEPDWSEPDWSHPDWSELDWSELDRAHLKEGELTWAHQAMEEPWRPKP